MAAGKSDPLKAKLAESGLGAEHAQALGLAWYSAADAGKKLPGIEARSGMFIPYSTLTGERSGFYRYRYLDAAARLPGAQRYAQPPGSGVQAYFPTIAGVNWPGAAKDVGVSLLVTEGELKAASAVAAGWLAIGLGGVWSWRSARAGVALLPELEAFEWASRSVYLVFDSDLRHKPQVRAALLALADALLARGAIVHDVVLPDLVSEGPNGEHLRNAKTGLDDFLVAKGAEELAQVISEARPINGSRALWDLSREVVYARDPGLIVEVETCRQLSARTFTEHAYSNRSFTEQRVNPTTGRVTLKTQPLAKTWLAWPHRAEVSKLVYAPGQPRITADGAFNLWRGWGAAPKRGDTAPWRALLEHLFDADREKIAWVEQWCAYPLQKPGTKLLTSVVVWGIAQGTGKSLLGYILGRIYGADNFSEIQPSDLADTWNDWQACKQFVMGDEIAGGDRRSEGSKIKRLVTAQTIRVSQKYVPAYTITDCANYYFTSNHPDPFAIELADRRYFVHEVTAPPRDAAFYAAIDKWLRSPDGPAALHYRLLHDVDTSAFNPNAPALWTAAKSDMAEASASDLEAWLLRLSREPDVVLCAAGVPEALLPELVTAEQLLAHYDRDGRHRITASRVGIAAKRVGLSVVRVRGSDRIDTADGRKRLYAVRNQERWAGSRITLADVREQMEKQGQRQRVERAKSAGAPVQKGVDRH